MGMILLSAQIAVIVLFAAAGLLALAARRGPWLRNPAAALLWLVSLGLLAVVGSAAWVLVTDGFEIPKLYYMPAGLLVASLVAEVATVVLLALGLIGLIISGTRTRDGGWAAAGWSARRQFGWAGVMAVAFVVTWLILANQLQGKIAALRAEAGALTLQYGPPNVPDAQNAGPLYEMAAEIFARHKADDAIPPEKFANGMDSLPPDDPDLQGYLQRRARGFELILTAVDRPACRFRHSWLDVDQMLNFAQAVRQNAYHLGIAARTAAAKGDLDLAARYVAAQYRLARHLHESPTLITALVTYAIEAVAAGSLQALLEAGRPSPEAVARLRAVPPVSYKLELHRVLNGETAFGLGEFARLADQGGMRFWAMAFLDAEVDSYRAFMKAWGQSLDEPYPKFQEKVGSGGGKLKDLASTPLASLIVPAVAKATEATIRADAYTRVSEYALGVAAYWAAEKKLPTRPEDLTPKYLPQVPLDPYTGEPLQFRVKDGQVVVYSVGMDRVDDHGTQFGTMTGPDGRALTTADGLTRGDFAVRVGVPEKKGGE